MAAYAFTCRTCSKGTEVEHPITANTPIPTPWCDTCGTRMHRVFTAPGVQFRGSGFYSTESR